MQGNFFLIKHYKHFLRLSIVTVVTLIFSTGCAEDSRIDVDESIYDLNNDGVPDISHEYFDNGYYELLDRNFDSKVDESYKYDLKNRIISGRTDDNLDGVLESYHYYVNGYICCSWVDTDENGLMDLYFEYEHGVLKYAERYYTGESAHIGKTVFEFGYPSSAERKNATKLTEKQFLDKSREKHNIEKGIIEYIKDNKL